MRVPEWLAHKIYERDSGVCQICGVKTRFGGLYDPPLYDKPVAGSVDHIKPVSKGGGNEENNLQWSCKSCNCSKGNRDEV